MTIQEIRIGDKVQDRNGFEFEVVALFKDGTVYCDFDGNEADIWEFKVDELESGERCCRENRTVSLR